MNEAKSFCISRKEVWEAYQTVKSNHGSAGIDGQTIEDFEKRLKKNLYRIWNRMSSGSYFPPPVRTVRIPKKSGGERSLGIPTVADRIAQQVVKARLEPEVDPHFHPDSYGYRPGKSALDAVGEARRRCWRSDWVLDLDIRAFFDNLDQHRLMRAVKKHASQRWMVLYIERWLKAPVEEENGRLVPRQKGTPQGGVISPLLANLFLHYAFDRWLATHYPGVPFERYADDAIVHCRTEKQAQMMRRVIEKRLLSADWNSIRRRRGSSIARMIRGREDTPMRGSIFLAMNFVQENRSIAKGRSSPISVPQSRPKPQRPSETRCEAGGCNTVAT
jgi:RNA-directed DNA polymerase